MRRVQPGVEPFALDGSGHVAALLVHGFTGTPNDLRSIGDYLASLGIGSRAPLLRGHGTHPNDMLDYGYQDWLADTEVALEQVLQRYRRVFLIGLSMGGTIALNLAARRAGDPRVAGVVTLCAPLRLRDWRLGLLPVLSRVVRWHAWGPPDIKDVSAWPRWTGYRRFRTRALLSLLGLLAETRALLPRVSQPLLVVQARDDHVVPPFNGHLIYDGVSSLDKRLIWLDNCYHIVTLDYEAPTVCAEVGRFIEDRSRDQLAAMAVPAGREPG